MDISFVFFSFPLRIFFSFKEQMINFNLSFFFLLQNSNNQVAIPGQNQVAQTQAETQGGPNTVLRVIVEQMVYPISLDVLYQVSYDFCFYVCRLISRLP